MPASIIALRIGGELQAGPMVAMTLVFLNFLRMASNSRISKTGRSL